MFELIKFTFFYLPRLIWRNRKLCPYWKGYLRVCGCNSYIPEGLVCRLGDAMENCLHYKR